MKDTATQNYTKSPQGVRFTRSAKSLKVSQREKKENPTKRPRVPPMSATKDAKS